MPKFVVGFPSSKKSSVYEPSGKFIKIINNDDVEKYNNVLTQNNFYSFIHGIKKGKKDMAFLVGLTDKYLIIFDAMGNIKTSFNLGNMCDKIIDMLMIKRMTGADVVKSNVSGHTVDDEDVICKAFDITCDESNHYSFVLDPDVLQLLFIAFNLDENNIPYGHEFHIKTGRGAHKKTRDIYATADELKGQLKKINSLLLKVYQNKNYNIQVAYKKGRSVVNNAVPHSGNKYMFKIDIHNFFPSCTRDLVAKTVKFLFSGIPNASKYLDKFLDIITFKDALAIGCPTSGIIANTILSPVITYMNNICKKHDMVLTCYADDITVSSSRFLSKAFVENMFNHAASTYNLTNFKLKKEKSYGLSGTRREVTGVIINNSDEISVKRRMYSNVRQCLYELSKGITTYTESKALLDYELKNKLITEEEYKSRLGSKVSININKLRGRLAYMHMVDQSGKYEKLIKQYHDVMRKYRLVSIENINKVLATK